MNKFCWDDWQHDTLVDAYLGGEAVLMGMIEWRGKDFAVLMYRGNLVSINY